MAYPNMHGTLLTRMELFKAFCFCAYMGLFIAQGLLVTATKSNGAAVQAQQLNYNVILAVLLAESGKLVLSLLQAFTCHNKGESVLAQLWDNRNLMILYVIPSGLYCLYNNLTYYNLSRMDPTTYFLLLQFRVVITGILFQGFFKTKLSRTQWFSLLILTTGCILKQSENLSIRSFTFRSQVEHESDHQLKHAATIVLIFIQIFASCFAGVYNEHLLKSVKLPVAVQNIFMYFDSTLLNLFLLLNDWHDLRMVNAEDHGEWIQRLANCFRPIVIWTIVNNVLIGIVTSYFLRYLNVILKAFASALEIVITAVLAFLIFDIAITANTVISIALVSVALWMYTERPIKQPVYEEQKIDKT